MTTIQRALGLAAAAGMLLSAADPAAAYVRHHHHYYRTGYDHRSYARDCWAEHHASANTGTVLGAIGGGIIGSQLAGRGSRGVGTVLGAGGGAVIGHQIGAHAHRC